MVFRLAEYENFLKVLRDSGRRIQTVAEFLETPDSKSIILRHDVDRKVRRSLAMARIETGNDVEASYYFRFRHGFPVDAIQEVAELGHEVGFHYETLSDAKGDRDRAIAMFLNQLEEFRKIQSCRTICAHGNPLSPWFSGDLAIEFIKAGNGLLGDASGSVPNDKVLYFTDSGGRWNDSSVNLCDNLGVMPALENPLNPDTLRRVLQEKRSLYISTHPERWTQDAFSGFAQWLEDSSKAAIKKIIRILRGIA